MVLNIENYNLNLHLKLICNINIGCNIYVGS